MNVSARGGICEKCGSLGRREEHLLMSNPPQQPYICTNAACKHHWAEYLSGVDYRTMPSMPGEVTWAVPDHVKRDEERREERFKLEQAEHKLHMEVLQKQLAQMDADAEYRKALLDGHLRQTAALEGILALLTQAYNDYERDCGCSLAVMD